MSTRSQRGFTLVELALVVVIISVLAAFAVPNLIAQSHRAKVYATKDTMTDVMMAAEDYALDHDGTFPATPNDLVEYATRQPKYAQMRNAFNHQNVWMNLNQVKPGDISYHALLDTTGTPVGYRIEARGHDDWLPTILERRPREDTF